MTHASPQEEETIDIGAHHSQWLRLHRYRLTHVSILSSNQLEVGSRGLALIGGKLIADFLAFIEGV